MNPLTALQEENSLIKLNALKHINAKVDEIWSETSLYLGKIEECFEDPSFPDREIASLVASKVYYHLAAYPDALQFALDSGAKLEISSKSDYISCILGKCLDEYTEKKQSGKPISPALEKMFFLVMSSWTKATDISTLKEVIGCTIAARRIDILTECLKNCVATAKSDILKYCLHVTNQYVSDDRQFRENVLKLLADFFQTLLSEPDFINAIHCLILLNDHGAVSGILESILSKKRTRKR